MDDTIVSNIQKLTNITFPVEKQVTFTSIDITIKKWSDFFSLTKIIRSHTSQV